MAFIFFLCSTQPGGAAESRITARGEPTTNRMRATLSAAAVLCLTTKCFSGELTEIRAFAANGIFKEHTMKGRETRAAPVDDGPSRTKWRTPPSSKPGDGAWKKYMLV